MTPMKIGMKMTKAVSESFTPEEMQELVQGSINHCLPNPPAGDKGTTLHYMTRHGELVAYVFVEGEKWKCYFAFASESPIPEEFPDDQRASRNGQKQV